MNKLILKAQQTLYYLNLATKRKSAAILYNLSIYVVSDSQERQAMEMQQC